MGVASCNYIFVQYSCFSSFSRVEKYQDTGQNSSVRAGGTKRINGKEILLCYCGNAQTDQYCKTWGPSSVHFTSSMTSTSTPRGHDIDKALESIYPQNLILPNQIHFDEGVAP
ncbi:hypothetical protein ACHAW5_001032 [Stephanodiscus triporus]|uniref:Uncharacterized protein n=1 Tax=Stephanodiscus triporus TaxID=2934178 RepID=A0ABD3PKC1_9STRA